MSESKASEESRKKDLRTSVLASGIPNAQLQVLKPGTSQDIMDSPEDKLIGLSDVATACQRILVRCPAGLDKVDWNWQRFQSAHGAYDLSRIEKGLPF